MAAELKVIADFYDFTLWLIQHTEKFPRHHRYSLGLAMENRQGMKDLNKERTEATENRTSVSSVSSLFKTPLQDNGYAPTV